MTRSKPLLARIVWFCALLLVALGMSGTMFLACATSGCSAASQDMVLRDATVTANTTASLIEALQSSALVIYRFEQEMQVAAAVKNGETKDSAKARVQVVRKLWEPVWTLFNEARTIYANLVLVLNAQPINAGQVQTEVNALNAKMLTLQANLAAARTRTTQGDP